MFQGSPVMAHWGGISASTVLCTPQLVPRPEGHSFLSKKQTPLEHTRNCPSRFSFCSLTLFPKTWGFHCKSHSRPPSTPPGHPAPSPTCWPQLSPCRWLPPPAPALGSALTVNQHRLFCTSAPLCARPESPLPFLDQHFNKVLAWAFLK